MKRYYTAQQSLAVRYKKPEYKEDRNTYLPQLICYDAAKAFVRWASEEMENELKAAVPGIVKAYFDLYNKKDLNGNAVIGRQCVVTAEDNLTGEEKKTAEGIIAVHQKKIAERMNSQPFMETEYGFMRFPKKAPHGIVLWQEARFS